MTLATFLLAAILDTGNGRAASPTGQLPDFAVPKTFALGDSVLPVGYLESYPVSDQAAILAPKDRAKVCRLVRAAHTESLRKYRQDYLLRTDTAFFKLIAANYPRARSAAGERGHVIFLRALADVVCAR